MPVRRRRRNLSQARTVNRRRSTAAPRRRSKGIFASMFGAVSQTEMRLEVESRVARDIWAVVYITLAALTYLSISIGMGPFGEWWEASARGLFGIGVHVVPAIFFIIGIVMLGSKSVQFNFTRVFGIFLLIATMLGIVHLAAPEADMLTQSFEYGGLTGFVASVFFRLALAELGAKIVLFALFLISLLLTFGLSFRDVISYVSSWVMGRELPEQEEEGPLTSKKEKPAKLAAEPQTAAERKAKVAEGKVAPAATTFKINKPTSIKVGSDFKPQKSKISDADWIPPSLELLDEAEEGVTMDEETLHAKADQIRQKLASFGIDVAMHDVNIGPTVMQYTLKPAEGVKLKNIVNLKHDLALALSAKSVRIQAPIPGTNLVGIEIPNEKRITVRMKELLMSSTFQKMKGTMKLILGRDVSGAPAIADLASMPHLLVAGQTGSGKSVGINAFLLSLIYQNSPNDLRLILVDPKRVELVPYNGIPHLLTPVINDPEKTVAALKWAITEMTRRYKECAKIHVRNIEEYNEKNLEEKFPYIVIVIDELADLMMVSGKEVEAAICRLAQMARAVGIHLILATQRPSVDVITGLIKANIPTRLAFRVAQGVDSKTILDSVGAEDLLGQGDMLYVPPGQSEPVRVQGAYISTEEVRKVTSAIKLELGDEEPEYEADIIDTEKQAEVVLPGVQPESNTNDNGDDATALRAARVVIETGRASASLLQRRLSLGYARAARIIDLLEERGFVGPSQGAKPRDIYITVEKLAELEGGVANPEAAAAENASRILDDMERGRH